MPLIDPGLVIALDTPRLDEARALAVRVRDAVGMLKVGLELFVEAGPAASALGREVDRPVFLDLKLHDIPETVERAVARAASHGASMLTVHASGGPAMLERAVRRAEAEGGGTSIVAVTVLTSLDATDLDRIGFAGDPAGQALRLARLAWEAGVRAFVCSPQEVGALREALGAGATLVTPGVRPAGTGAGDQKRVATPRGAVLAGADAVVVGRPIRDAADPLAAAMAIAGEVREARAARA